MSLASQASSVNKRDPEMTIDEQLRLPGTDALDRVGELVVVDRNGKSHKFRSLWDRKEPTERRNIIVFIRHFFCGVCFGSHPLQLFVFSIPIVYQRESTISNSTLNRVQSCQEYVRSLSSQMSTAGLYLRNPPSTLSIIGCGDPALINEYVKRTNCKFDVYTDPTRAIYIELGMTLNLGLGDKKPDYIKKNLLESIASDVWTTVSNPTASPGKKSQNGGEWIFVDGVLKWCRRMRHTRDHIEIGELKLILDNQKEAGDRDGKYAEMYRDS